ncbi:MAG: hypothetical protein EBR82_31465 [Caulobacteraceae bacterium]|nr:hypothetical protein [Caulobacteraceae bacterium]
MICIESGFSGIAAALNTPRIGGFPIAGTAAGSTEATGYSAANAQGVETYTFWRPTAMPATWTLTFTATSPVSYFGIAAHDLATQGCTVEYQTLVSGVWTTRLTHTPTDNQPIFGLVAQRSLTAARLRFTGATAPTIGVIFFGDVTEFPQRAAYTGRSDWQDLITDEYRTNAADGGAVIGRYVARKSQPVTLSVSHLSEMWKAATLDPLLSHLRLNPVFAAERPSDFPKSVIFGYATKQPVPTRDIAKADVAVSVSIEFSGHVA